MLENAEEQQTPLCIRMRQELQFVTGQRRTWYKHWCTPTDGTLNVSLEKCSTPVFSNLCCKTFQGRFPTREKPAAVFHGGNLSEESVGPTKSAQLTATGVSLFLFHYHML